jgi:hypothetical protein
MTLTRLSDAIESLRTELEHAQKEGESKELRFNIEAIEIELEVLVEKEGSGDTKVNWWILAAGAEARVKNANKHRLKLTLKAVDASGQPLRVSKLQEHMPE